MRQHGRLMEIIERSLTGPIMDEESFNNVNVTGQIQRVINEYDIKADRKTIVNFDDDLADRVWQAAIDFFSSCGVYCQTTNRVIHHDRQEIERILQRAPAEVYLGEGTDTCIERARKVEDPNPPLSMGGPIGMPISEKYFVPIMQSYVQEPLIDVTCPGSLSTVQGREIRTRSPLEILASWEEVDLMNIVLRRVGRPGMAWTGIVISVSDIGQLSAINQARKLPPGMFTFGIISEMKTNFDILNKLAHGVTLGTVIDPYANPIYGGLCGGTEGLAVLLTASMIALNVVFLASCVGTSPTHPFLFNNTGREIMKASSLAFQAIARNSNLMTNMTVSPVGGPGTKTVLYETLALTIMSTVSGVSRMLGPRSAVGTKEDHCSGLEARFMAEIAHASASLTRTLGEEIVQKALVKYEDDLNKKPYGKRFDEVYDTQFIKPSTDWVRIYEEVKNEALEWGLNLD
jgi:methylamine--corrinoid protein Co-methyltransferase